MIALVGCGVDPAGTTPEPTPPSAARSVGAASPRAPFAEASTSPAPSPDHDDPAAPIRRSWDRPRPDCAKLKCIALTFDDGPLGYTSELAAILKQERVRATFFLLGSNVERFPRAVLDVQATGSELGNHSWSHPMLTRLSDRALRNQLERTSAEIKKLTGVEVSIMRPPYGANNRRVDRVAEDLGLAEIYWNVDTLDWKYPSSQRLIDLVLSGAQRNQVVLMHDIHPSTVEAARSIIRGLKAQGYTLVTVSELYPHAEPGGHYPTWQGRGLATGNRTGR